ncbi:unnamed protein product [Schistosoma margrebowiei]|uniref:Uncharacterized protein n=1 Tax=Schistosoma margrebowiei TaxID=48269 RepID=A0A3P7XR46_9TREM|nr:unnamed protein product [Schistosoma margrebowiei]
MSDGHAGGPTSIGRSVGAASLLGGFSEANRFINFLKCFTYLFRCSSLLVITLPSLLFTDHSGLQWLPESFFFMSYSCLMFPSLAAFSALSICLTAILIYSVVGEMIYIGRFLCTVSMSSVFSEAGLLNPSKCFTHLLLFSRISMIGLLSLSLTGLSRLQYFPVSCFVVTHLFDNSSCCGFFACHC